MTLPSIVPVQSDVLTSLRNFLLFALPSGMEIIQGQNNRVPGPIGPDYVVMTPITMKRLSTNVDLYADCAFTSSVFNSTLSVTKMQHGNIVVGHQLYPTNSIPTPSIFISNQMTGTGGVGTYGLSYNIQGSLASQTMASGVLFAMQPTEVCVQLDVYGPNSFANSQIISTLFRDDFAIQNFINSDIPAPSGWQNIPSGGTLSVPFDGVRPLYCDDPVQLTQIFGEMQYEIRWKLEAYLQANMIVVAPQQFFANARINPIEVDTTFP